MGLLLLALVVVLLGSLAVVAAIVHRRRHETRRQRDIATRAAEQAVAIAVERVKGVGGEWRAPNHS